MFRSDIFNDGGHAEIVRRAQGPPESLSDRFKDASLGISATLSGGASPKKGLVRFWGRSPQSLLHSGREAGAGGRPGKPVMMVCKGRRLKPGQSRKAPDLGGGSCNRQDDCVNRGAPPGTADGAPYAHYSLNACFDARILIQVNSKVYAKRPQDKLGVGTPRSVLINAFLFP